MVIENGRQKDTDIQIDRERERGGEERWGEGDREKTERGREGERDKGNWKLKYSTKLDK
jgi:hypothetical protein